MRAIAMQGLVVPVGFPDMRDDVYGKVYIYSHVAHGRFGTRTHVYYCWDQRRTSI